MRQIDARVARAPFWAALEHPELYPFIIMLADTRGQASINAASVQHELRNNDLILSDYGHLKYNASTIRVPSRRWKATRTGRR